VFVIATQQRTNNLVRVGEKAMPFDEGLPILTAMLKNGDTHRKLTTLDSLAYYGDRLLGSEAFKQILILASATNSFPNMDIFLKLPPEKQKKWRAKEQSPDEEAEMDRLAVNIFALAIVVGCGADKDGVLLKRYLGSTNPSQRYIGENVPSVINSFWCSGNMHPSAKKPFVPKIDAARSLTPQ
jgi:hypothetical protein